MVKKAICLVLLALSIVNANACDVCGCSVNGFGAGLLSAYRYNVISLRYYQSPFEQILQRGIPTEDVFHQSELNLRYHLSPKFIVSVNQSFQWNRRVGPGNDAFISGLGDTRLRASYVFLDNILLGESSSLYWELGTGIKLPSGKYDPNIYRDDLPENFNIGNGSWGYLFQSSLLLHYYKFGLVANGSYQSNQATKDGYDFGDQFSLSMILFRRFSLSEKWELVPFGGGFHERIQKDELYNDKNAHGTGGRGYFFSTGMNIKYDAWLIGASYFNPFNQAYAEGEMRAKSRFSLELTYTF